MPLQSGEWILPFRRLGAELQRILVTGASSFVGKYLIPLLVNSGHEVQGIIRKTDVAPKVVFEPRSFFRPHLIGDLSDKEFLKSLKWKPDIIIHLAANSDVNADMSKIFKDNVTSVENLLEFAKIVGCPKLIAISTISVHGDVLHQSVSESTGFVKPNKYGFTKRAAEILLQRDTNLRSKYVVRLPAVLGFGASKHWISRVFLSATKNNEIEIHNPSSLFNNAIYINDLLRFLEQLILRPDICTYAFPIASTKPIEIKAIVDLIIEHSNSNSKVLVSKKITKSFTIDDRYAREKFSYNSLTISSAIQNYIEDSILLRE